MKNSQIVDWLNSMRLGDGGFISTGEYIQPTFAQKFSTNITNWEYIQPKFAETSSTNILKKHHYRH